MLTPSHYAPYPYRQRFSTPGKKYANLEVDILTCDVYEMEYEILVTFVAYGSPSYNPPTGNIITQATNRALETFYVEAGAACFDARRNLIDSGWRCDHIESNTTIPLSLHTVNFGGNNCSSADAIKVFTSGAH